MQILRADHCFRRPSLSIIIPSNRNLFISYSGDTLETIFQNAVWICIAAVITLVFYVLWILIKDQTRYLFVVFSLLGGILLVLFSLSFECTVDEYAIRYAYYGVLFKKEIKWQDVLCVRTVERHHEKDVTVVLYDNDGNGIATFSSEMENVWYVVKMAEHQGIEVKKEKDLTLNEIRRL